MHTVTLRKKFSLSFIVPAPKVRARNIKGGNGLHADKRRENRYTERIRMQKENG